MWLSVICFLHLRIVWLLLFCLEYCCTVIQYRRVVSSRLLPCLALPFATVAPHPMFGGAPIIRRPPLQCNLASVKSNRCKTCTASAGVSRELMSNFCFQSSIANKLYSYSVYFLSKFQIFLISWVGEGEKEGSLIEAARGLHTWELSWGNCPLCLLYL